MFEIIHDSIGLLFRANIIFIAGCIVYQSIYLPTLDLRTTSADPFYNVTHDSCVLIDELGRFVLSEFDFNVTFAMPDRTVFPKPMPKNTILVPDYTSIVTRFTVDAFEDIGGTLKIHLVPANPVLLVCKC